MMAFILCLFTPLNNLLSDCLRPGHTALETLPLLQPLPVPPQPRILLLLPLLREPNIHVPQCSPRRQVGKAKPPSYQPSSPTHSASALNPPSTFRSCLASHSLLLLPPSRARSKNRRTSASHIPSATTAICFASSLSRPSPRDIA